MLFNFQRSKTVFGLLYVYHPLGRRVFNKINNDFFTTVDACQNDMFIYSCKEAVFPPIFSRRTRMPRIMATPQHRFTRVVQLEIVPRQQIGNRSRSTGRAFKEMGNTEKQRLNDKKKCHTSYKSAFCTLCILIDPSCGRPTSHSELI